MGAWGTGVFDNDTACDWCYGLEEANDLSLVIETFANVLNTGDDYLDSDPASEALAACEVIARLRGKLGVSNPYTETMDRWVAAHPTLPPPELVDQALAVIDRVLTSPSELYDLWSESDDFDDWRKVVDELKARLQS